MRRFLLIALLLSLAGCATVQVVTLKCRHTACAAADAWQDETRDPVRIMTGWMPNHVPHAQAQACIKGQWTWLHVIDGKVYADNIQDDFIPDQEWTPDNFRLLHIVRPWR